MGLLYHQQGPLSMVLLLLQWPLVCPPKPFCRVNLGPVGLSLTQQEAQSEPGLVGTVSSVYYCKSSPVQVPEGKFGHLKAASGMKVSGHRSGKQVQQLQRTGKEQHLQKALRHHQVCYCRTNADLTSLTVFTFLTEDMLKFFNITPFLLRKI